LNDSFTHASLTTLPFGGVGTSGQGAYRGKATFDCFTHRRTMAEVPDWIDGLLRVRYFPYQASDLKRFQWMNLSKPDFDRSGKKVNGVGYWMWLIFGLGGPSAKGALFRWVVLLSTSYVALNGIDKSRLPFELPFELPHFLKA
jgi:beta-apo-4'-carotenal oxygenase